VKNKLSNADSVLEAARMENKTLADKVIAVTKENVKLNNRLRSQLESKQLATQRLIEIEKQCAEFKEELAKERKNFQNINKAYMQKCDQLDKNTRRIEELERILVDMKKKVTLCGYEEASYKKILNEIKKGRAALIEGHIKADQAHLELKEMNKIVKANTESLKYAKTELCKVMISSSIDY